MKLTIEVPGSELQGATGELTQGDRSIIFFDQNRKCISDKLFYSEKDMRRILRELG